MALPPAFAAKIKEHMDAGASPAQAFGKAITKKCPKCGTAMVGKKCPKCDPEDDSEEGDEDGDEDEG